jgi:hypothetical protein
MRLLEFNQSVSLTSVIDAIKSVPEKEVSLRLSPDIPWLSNPVNKKILRKATQGFGKSIHFEGEEEIAAVPASPAVVVNQAPEISDHVQTEDYQEENKDPDETGFVVGEDIAAAPTQSLPVATTQIKPKAETDFTPSQISTRYVSKNKFARFAQFLMAHKMLSIVGAAVVVFLLLGYAILFLPRADIKIIVEERALESTSTVTASAKVTSPDIKNRIIPAITKTSSQSGTLQAQTSGSKTVGTKAAGSVTLYNNTDFSKSIAAGSSVTATTSTGPLKFAIGSAVTLPKRNSVTGVPSGVDIALSSADFGDKYNVAASTAFTLDQDPADVKGTNSQPFSGGSSKTVQVVSQADLDKLTSDLTKTLTDKSRSDVLSQVGKDYTVTSDAIKTSATNKSFDHSVGDQTDAVTLSLIISASATVYKSQDLKDMLISTLESNAPDGFEVDKPTAEMSSNLVNVSDSGDLTFSGHIKADLRPKLDESKLASDLAGKVPSTADPIVKSIPQIISYNVSFWPNLPAPLKRFPRDPNRIHITFSVNKQ